MCSWNVVYASSNKVCWWGKRQRSQQLVCLKTISPPPPSQLQNNRRALLVMLLLGLAPLPSCLPLPLLLPPSAKSKENFLKSLFCHLCVHYTNSAKCGTFLKDQNCTFGLVSLVLCPLISGKKKLAFFFIFALWTQLAVIGGISALIKWLFNDT